MRNQPYLAGSSLSEQRHRALVAISFYDRRCMDHLQDLLRQLDTTPAGDGFDLAVIVNATSDARPTITLPRPASVIYRHNTGMNIGAWNAALQFLPGYDAYVFLQDECYLRRPNWLRAVLGALAHPEVGLVGESLNPAWDKPWEQLATLHAGARLPDHFIDGAPAERVRAYQHALAGWKIEPGPTGRHLRSLTWAISGETARRIGGFPVGANYGECIAAEIGVSRQIESLGLRLAQVAPEPFHAIGHIEWNRDDPYAPHSHRPLSAVAATGPSREMLDAETIRIWSKLSVESASGPTLDQSLAVEALALRLRDRENEIRRLRGLLTRANTSDRGAGTGAPTRTAGRTNG